MDDQHVSGRDDAGPLRLYDRWPAIHIAIATAVLVAGVLNRPWLNANTSWLWFVVLAIPVLAAHEWEEFGFPGGFRRWFNVDVCRSTDPDTPLTKKQAALNHMPLMLLFPFLAVVGTRWPWIGLAGLYSLVADGFFHLSASGITRRYSPGLVTALLLYLPLGVSATYYLVATGQVSLTGLLAAVFSGVLGLNFFLFIPMLRPARLEGNQREPSHL